MAVRQPFSGSVEPEKNPNSVHHEERFGLMGDNQNSRMPEKTRLKTIRRATTTDTSFKAVKECFYLETKIKDSIRVSLFGYPSVGLWEEAV